MSLCRVLVWVCFEGCEFKLLSEHYIRRTVFEQDDLRIEYYIVHVDARLWDNKLKYCVSNKTSLVLFVYRGLYQTVPQYGASGTIQRRFTEGNHYVEYKAVDDAGNFARCSFHVNVIGKSFIILWYNIDICMLTENYYFNLINRVANKIQEPIYRSKVKIYTVVFRNVVKNRVGSLFSTINLFI